MARLSEHCTVLVKHLNVAIWQGNSKELPACIGRPTYNYQNQYQLPYTLIYKDKVTR